MKYFFLALFLLIATTIYAQNITGRVHGESGEPLAGATASLLIAKDSSQLLSTATDESGNFTFRNVASNQYLVKITAVDYTTYFSSAFNTNGGDYIVPALTMSKANTVLSNITVTAKRPPVEEKSGKTVVNVDASTTNTG